MENKLKRISDTKLLALHMITCAEHGYSAFFADVYDAVSELIERRKANGEWKGLADDEELKPCPFCNCTELVKAEEQLCRVYCENCFSSGPPMLTIEKAIEAWNRRIEK